MSSNDIGQLLAYVASAIGVVMVVPQIHRIVRHPNMGGVSPWRWSILVVACTLWFTYGVRSGSLPQIPGNVLLVSGAFTIVLLIPSTRSKLQRGSGLAALTAALVVASTWLSPERVGFMAFLVGLASMWPQVYETVWRRRGQGRSSLSISSSALTVVSQTMWLIFAVITHDVPVTVAATVTLSTNLIITIVEASRHRASLRSAPDGMDLLPDAA